MGPKIKRVEDRSGYGIDGLLTESAESGRSDLQCSSLDLTVESDFEALYRKHSAELLRYARRCVGRPEIAEEITGEAFLRLYRDREHIDPSRLPGWLFTAVKNLAASFWRRSVIEQRYASRPVAATKTAQPGVLDSILSIRQLKPVHRTCLILRYVYGMERVEIAARLGLTDNQVKSCLQYGLELLRKHLSEGRSEL